MTCDTNRDCAKNIYKANFFRLFNEHHIFLQMWFIYFSDKKGRIVF